MRTLPSRVLSVSIFCFVLVLLCLLALTGCAGMPGNNTAPNSGGNPGISGATPQFTTYLYGTGFGDSIAAFRMDENSGALTPVQSPFPGTNQGEMGFFAIPDPRGRFMFLQQRDDSPAQKAPVLSTFKIDAATGALSVVSSVVRPLILAGVIEPKGNFMYAVEGTVLHVYRLDNAGNFTQASATQLKDSPFPELPSMTTDSAGRFLFIVGTSTDNKEIKEVIYAFSLDPNSGAATAVTGSPFASELLVGNFAQHPGGTIEVLPSGNVLYLLGEVDGGDGRIQSFTISSSGSLTPGPVTALDRAFEDPNLAIDPGGRFLYVTDLLGLTIKIRGFAINSSTGGLTPLPGSPFAATSINSGIIWESTAVDPTGKFLYVSSQDNNTQIHRFSINQSTGALSEQPGTVPILPSQSILFFLRIAH